MSWYDIRGFSHIAERLPQHCVYHNTSTLSKWMNECCHNVVEMFYYNVLWQRCGNVVATFLKLSWNMLQQLNLPTFSQLSPNVVETLLQPYIVSWDDLITHCLSKSMYWFKDVLYCHRIVSKHIFVWWIVILHHIQWHLIVCKSWRCLHRLWQAIVWVPLNICNCENYNYNVLYC